jgi:hypothetical protein
MYLETISNNDESKSRKTKLRKGAGDNDVLINGFFSGENKEIALLKSESTDAHPTK